MENERSGFWDFVFFDFDVYGSSNPMKKLKFLIVGFDAFPFYAALSVQAWFLIGLIKLGSIWFILEANLNNKKTMLFCECLCCYVCYSLFHSFCFFALHCHGCHPKG